MAASWAAALSDVIGDNRWAGERLARLADVELELYARILRRFVAGRPPRATDPELGRAGAALARLVRHDLVQVDAAGNVAVAYPFCARPTRHRVRLAAGRSYWANCAVDALGIPYLLGERAVIEATEPGSERQITISVKPETGTVRSEPAAATVVIASSGDGCAAACACPHINLFTSRSAAARHLAARGLRGSILDLADAAAAGRALFGDLGYLLGAPPDRARSDGGARSAGLR
jgi:hypothetical protein